jgi:hypothetical protein
MTQDSCKISDLFKCAGSLGVVQHACIPETIIKPVNGSSWTLVFRASLASTAKRIGCGANQQLSITSAEVGVGRDIKVSTTGATT